MPYKIKPAELKQRWLDYSKKCDELYIEKVRYRELVIEVPKRIIYCLEAFCSYAGVKEEELKVLEKNPRYKNLVEDIRLAILARKLEALVNGEGSTSGLIFDLKANYGLYAKKAGDREDQDYNITFNLDTPTLDTPQSRMARRKMYESEYGEGYLAAAPAPPPVPPPAPSQETLPEKPVYASYTHIY